MGIYIKGLDMPKGGQFIAVFGAGEAYLFDGAYIAESDNCIGEGEAFKIPTPHGRLIDANDLIELFPDDEGAGNWTYNKTAQGFINAVPTIIESEGIDGN